MKHRSLVLILSLSMLVSSQLLGAVGSGASPARTRSNMKAPGPISWHPCPSGLGFRCGDVRVPVDYAHPAKSSLTIAVNEIVATKPTGQPGVLFFNPGGPGESGVQILPVLAAMLPPEIRAQFNLVSFDERGTGESDRLSCGPSPASVANVTPAPRTKHGPLPGAKVFGSLYRSCHAKYPVLLSHITTTTAARDMDRIRQALGVPAISYWGLSYGTVLGAVYASMFPAHVHSMILDGAVDANLSLSDSATAEVPAIAASLAHFFTSCQTSPVCPLRANPLGSFHQLLTNLGNHQLSTGTSGGTAGQGDLASATLFALSVPEFVGQFEAAVNAALAGRGGPLASLALSFEQDLDGTSLVAPQWAYTCNDFSGHLGPAAAGKLAHHLDREQAVLGAYAVSYNLGGCIGWPNPSHPLRDSRSHVKAPILVVGNTGDPNTPHSGAVGLARALGKARLLTWLGWGHTWLLNGSSDQCMAQAVEKYLINSIPPQAGEVCA